MDVRRKLIVGIFVVAFTSLVLGASLLFSSSNSQTEESLVVSKTELPAFPDKYEVSGISQEDIVLVKNECNFFPFTIDNISGLVVSVGKSTYPFTSMMSNLTATQIVSLRTISETKTFLQKRSTINQLLLAIHVENNNAEGLAQLEKELKDLIQELPHELNKGIVVFGSPYLLRDIQLLDEFNGVVIAYENSSIIQNRTAQKIGGSLPMTGQMNENINVALKKGAGIQYKALNRLAFVTPEEVGIRTSDLKELDKFIAKGVEEGVYPGCQVAFAYKGKVVYNKSFGNFTYDSITEKVDNQSIYDLASLTKVLSSTPALMMLQSKGKFDLSKKLVDYLPELVTGTYYQNITIRSIMAHQAGFAAFIPFYKRTLINKELDSTIYSTVKTAYFNLPVAKDIWINEHYRDTMMNEILHKRLENPGKYKYSDIGYYFVERIVEKLGGQSLDVYVKNHLYRKLGLNRTGYLPLTFYPAKKIAPTENDLIFRKQIVQGYVHDPGAAMQGGVAGHAGLFSNATDILAILQMYLNKGEYAGQQLIDAKVVEEFTRQQFNGNRRAAGFDRPTSGRKPDSWPISDLASDNSYGHSGFTGTFVWVDPDKELAFVFLCNRVYPDAENWKISKQRIRVKAHRMVYELLPK